MSDNIKPLFPGQPTGADPVPALVEMLTDLLAMAKTGELQSLAFAGTCADNTVSSGVMVGNDVFTLLGALRYIETKLTSEIE